MYQLLESKKAGLQYSTCMCNTPWKSNLLLLINGVLHTQVEYYYYSSAFFDSSSWFLMFFMAIILEPWADLPAYL